MSVEILLAFVFFIWIASSGIASKTLLLRLFEIDVSQKLISVLGVRACVCVCQKWPLILMLLLLLLMLFLMLFLNPLNVLHSCVLYCHQKPMNSISPRQYWCRVEPNKLVGWKLPEHANTVNPAFTIQLDEVEPSTTPLSYFSSFFFHITVIVFRSIYHGGLSMYLAPSNTLHLLSGKLKRLLTSSFSLYLVDHLYFLLFLEFVLPIMAVQAPM